MTFQQGVPFGPSTFGPSLSGLPNLTAIGVDLASAYLISASDSVFTHVAAGTGCRLPAPSNQQYTIYNYSSNVLLIYPSSGDRIAQLAVNQAISLSPNNSFTFSSFNSALTPLPRQWYVTGGSSNSNASGDVVGPAGAVRQNVPMFADNSGTVIADSGIPVAGIVQGPTAATLGDIAVFGTSGVVITDSGVLAAKVVQGPTVAVSGDIPSFNGAGGRLLQDSGIEAADVVTSPGGATISAAMKPVVSASTLDLARQAMGVNAAACVVMLPVQPRAVPATWLVYKPDGTLLNTSGTVTNGLQEAINYAVEFGYDFIIYGGGVVPGSWPPPFDPVGSPGADHTTLNYGAPIIVPSIQKGRWVFGSVTFNYTGPSTDVTWSWDSTELFQFDSSGAQWVANTSNIIMEWLPTNPWPEDPFGPSTGSVYFKLGAIVQIGTGPCARIDATNGPVVGGIYEFTELNGGTSGLELVGGTHGCSQNIIRAALVHINTSACVSIGISTADANTVSGNILDLTVVGTNNTVGIDIFGTKNVIRGSVINGDGTNVVGVKFETSAADNQLQMARMEGATPLLDLSTARSNAVNFGSNFVSVNKGGSNQGIATATLTKVAFSNVVYDTDSTYDAATNYRWTPGIPGKARVDVQVTWVTGGANGTILSLLIYKNGVAIFNHQGQSANVIGNQSISFSAQVSIDSATDYFEIFVNQISGGALSIDGTNANTWVMYERIR